METPPRRTARPVSPKIKLPPIKARATKQETLGEKIANQVTAAGMLLGVADPVAGFVLVTNAENFGDSWANVAAVNPRVKAILEKWFSASVYGDCGMATLAIALPLATHYKLLPKAWFNPAGPMIEQVEVAVSEGTSLADLLKADAENKAAMQAMRDMFSKMDDVKVDMSDSDEFEAPDHYEVPKVA